MDFGATNYNPAANSDDNSCIYPTATTTDQPETDFNYCVSWGDPHIIMFKDSIGTPINSFHSYVSGVKEMFGINGLVVKTEQEKWGNVAVNKRMFVEWEGSQVFEMNVDACTPETAIYAANVDIPVADISAVSSAYWPTKMIPSTMAYLVDFDDIQIFVKCTYTWSTPYMDVGIGYKGDVTTTTGFCQNIPDEPVVPLPTCTILESCCDQYSNALALFDGCMADAQTACCETENTDATCCDFVSTEKCDVDFTCSEGECCDAEDGLCSPCVEEGDCEGEWSVYGECSQVPEAECGVGGKNKNVYNYHPSQWRS
jgi:hypothetical protein